MAPPKNQDQESIDRYEKLLSDWKPGGSPARSGTSPAAASPSVSSSSGASSARDSAAPTPVAGAILLLSGSSLAIYLRHMPEKEYHLALLLQSNGTVKAQGIALEGHQVDELGTLPARFVDELKQKQIWPRDLIVFHCYSFDDVRRLPAGGLAAGEGESSAPAAGSAASSAPSASHRGAAAPQGLRRGQRLTIRFGANTWDAIYWGRDDQGSVLAHKTNNEWALMHLDLDRFQNDTEVSPDVDPALVDEIQNALS